MWLDQGVIHNSNHIQAPLNSPSYLGGNEIIMAYIITPVDVTKLLVAGGGGHLKMFYSGGGVVRYVTVTKNVEYIPLFHTLASRYHIYMNLYPGSRGLFLLFSLRRGEV